MAYTGQGLTQHYPQTHTSLTRSHLPSLHRMPDNLNVFFLQRQRHATVCCAYRPNFIGCFACQETPSSYERSTAEQVFYRWVARSGFGSSSFILLLLRNSFSTPG